MRRTTTVTIDADGRDKGKSFLITEMPADQAEWWGIRALILLVQSGAEIPDDVQTAGMAGFATMGVQALFRLDSSALKPLLDEMWACVMYQPPKSNSKPVVLFEGENSQIEEWRTRIMLRKAVMDLHLGFSEAADALSTESLPRVSTA